MLFFFLSMDIYLKNKFIYYDNYKIKCAIGKRGISSQKKEGDKCTPRGRFEIKYIFYRKDRVKKLISTIKKIPIKKNYAWCDDNKSNKYNKLVKLPFKYGAEKLFLKNNTYDIIVVIDYNLNPIKKGKGSAIFLHVAKKNFNPTLGCIALSKKKLKFLLANITKKSYINIV